MIRREGDNKPMPNLDPRITPETVVRYRAPDGTTFSEPEEAAAYLEQLDRNGQKEKLTEVFEDALRANWDRFGHLFSSAEITAPFLALWTQDRWPRIKIAHENWDKIAPIMEPNFVAAKSPVDSANEVLSRFEKCARAMVPEDYAEGYRDAVANVISALSLNTETPEDN